MSEAKQFTDIPSTFYSFHSNDLFTNCIECNRNLLEDDCEYVIEKAIRNYPDFKASDVIFDYAICMNCAHQIHNELSEESLQSIQNYFSQHLNLNQRARQLAEANGDINEMISRCMISDKSIAHSEEYQIFAHCKGKKVSLQNPPYMLSGEILSQIAEILSEKTRDDLDGFFNKHFAPDPGLLEPTPRILLV